MDSEPLPQIFRTFKYRLLLTKKQHAALAAILESQRLLYNGALEHRINAYNKAGRTVTRYDQQKELTQLRQHAEFATIPANLQRWTLHRLDDAYQAFFRRVKAKEGKAGFPRYRGKGRWKSFGFSEFSGIRVRGKRLYWMGLPGSLRIGLHRPLPDGKPLGCVFTRDHKGWLVCLHYRVPVLDLPATGKQVGIDMGLTTLAMLSTGEAVPNPRVAKRAERELRRRQRALARCKRGSKRRRKVRTRVTRLHARIANARRTYLHQVSARLVRKNSLIAVERLNVKGLTRTMLARSVSDAGWSTLKEMLTYKAEWAGRQLVEVDPRNTSLTCSGCGVIVPKDLKERWHRCPDCGLELDRDHNAALNVLHRAVVRPGLRNAGQWPERAAGNIALASLGETLPTSTRPRCRSALTSYSTRTRCERRAKPAGGA